MLNHLIKRIGVTTLEERTTPPRGKDANDDNDDPPRTNAQVRSNQPRMNLRHGRVEVRRPKQCTSIRSTRDNRRLIRLSIRGDE